MPQFNNVNQIADRIVPLPTLAPVASQFNFSALGTFQAVQINALSIGEDRAYR